jgi:hypothetical protein
MELKDKMMRSVARNVAEKAIEDMKTDPMRSVRRMIDMAALFRTGNNRNNFLPAQNKLPKTQYSPYKNIAAHLANNIDRKISFFRTEFRLQWFFLRCKYPS